MNPEVEIIQLDKPGWGVIGGGISSFNKRQAGDGHTRYLCCVLEAIESRIGIGCSLSCCGLGMTYVGRDTARRYRQWQKRKAAAQR